MQYIFFSDKTCMHVINTAIIPLTKLKRAYLNFISFSTNILFLLHDPIQDPFQFISLLLPLIMLKIIKSTGQSFCRCPSIWVSWIFFHYWNKVIHFQASIPHTHTDCVLLSAPYQGSGWLYILILVDVYLDQFLTF